MIFIQNPQARKEKRHGPRPSFPQRSLSLWQREEIQALLEHGVKSVAVSAGNMGCPHEEEEDFPLGEDCPFCPFWAGKQGSNRRD
jgi:hypothetical protein